jgi:anaphase-promoting complex subunit 3
LDANLILDLFAVRGMQSMSMGMTTPSSVSIMPKASLFSSTGAPSGFAANGRTSRFETPGLTPIPANTSTALSPESGMHQQDPRVIRRAQQVAARLYYQPSPETPHTAEIRTSLQYLRGLGRQVETSATPIAGETPVRRGGRAKEGSESVVQSALSTSSFVRQPRALFMSAENNKNKTTDQDKDHTMNQPEGSVQCEKETGNNGKKQEGIKEVLVLLCHLGSGWRRICQVECSEVSLVHFLSNFISFLFFHSFQYRCQEALQIFSQLPHAQQNTGWVLNQQGRAYFEMNDFNSARRCLELMQSVEPHRMQGLDLLSTVYWQLKKEVELAHLAQRAVDFDNHCPEAWCVVGNCFSLQKEHETALSYFKRSLQIDPNFTYTHTLSGYEYMANEDFDKAVACFRNAIRSDERHYNAWYGLGAIYHRQEKYDLAEYHFERAVSINPQSSVLRCNLGIAQFSNGKAYVALDTLAEAFRLDPRNPQARFQRATIYSAMNRPAEALAELEKVRDAAPREATVHFAIGRMLKRLGRLEEAMKCFLTAMDLDPKDSQLIKSAMDKLGEPDIAEDLDQNAVF